jgi:phosphoenolpyruvate-protein phosphotransferase (PTS system enzyme I)
VKLTGIGASEGVAVGPAFVPATGRPEPERDRITEDEVEPELQRFREAVETVVGNLSETADRLRTSGSEEEAGIFEFHVEMAEDPELASAVEERVGNLESPEAAVLAVGEEFAAEYAAMNDEYMAARADDVRDVTGQISDQLMGRGISAFEALRTPSVVLSRRGWRSGSSPPRGRGLRTSRSWPAPWVSQPSSASDPSWSESWAPRRSRSTEARAT